MAAVIIELADAVAAEIESIPYAAFSVERKYIPLLELANLESPVVTVVPSALSAVPQTRGSDEFEYTIDAAYHQKIEPTELNLDPLMEQVAEIMDLFRGVNLQLAEAGRLSCVQVANAPIYDLEVLDQMNLFRSVMRFTFRHSRARA